MGTLVHIKVARKRCDLPGGISMWSSAFSIGKFGVLCGATCTTEALGPEHVDMGTGCLDGSGSEHWAGGGMWANEWSMCALMAPVAGSSLSEHMRVHSVWVYRPSKVRSMFINGGKKADASSPTTVWLWEAIWEQSMTRVFSYTKVTVTNNTSGIIYGNLQLRQILLHNSKVAV